MKIRDFFPLNNEQLEVSKPDVHLLHHIKPKKIFTGIYDSQGKGGKLLCTFC